MTKSRLILTAIIGLILGLYVTALIISDIINYKIESKLYTRRSENG